MRAQDQIASLIRLTLDSNCSSQRFKAASPGCLPIAMPSRVRAVGLARRLDPIFQAIRFDAAERVLATVLPSSRRALVRRLIPRSRVLRAI